MMRNPEENRKVLYGLKKDFKYYRYDEYKDMLTLPRGMAPRFYAHLEKHAIPFETKQVFVEKKLKANIISKITLRDYQVPLAAEIQKHTTGVVFLSVGGGKTILALDYIAKAGLTATVLVHNKVLLKQWKEKCEEFLWVTPSICGEGKKNVGEITIATVQMLQSDPLLKEKLAAQTSILIVDECDRYISDGRRGVLEAITPKVMFGFSGTPERSVDDGQTDAIQFIFGPIIAEHQVVTMPPLIKVFMTDVAIETEEYPDMQHNLVHHHVRNKLIAGLALGEILSGRKILILTKRIAHYELLKESYIGECDKYYYVDSKAKDRDDLLYGITDGSKPYSLIAGTYSLLGTGFDVQTLETVFLAGDLKSNVTTVQSIGRALRLLKGKNPTIYDFCDNRTPMFKRQFKVRYNIYKAKGWKIEWHGISEEAAQKWL